MKLLSTALYTAAAGFLIAALLGHSDAWSPAALLGLAGATTRIQYRRHTDTK